MNRTASTQHKRRPAAATPPANSGPGPAPLEPAPLPAPCDPATAHRRDPFTLEAFSPPPAQNSTPIERLCDCVAVHDTLTVPLGLAVGERLGVRGRLGEEVIVGVALTLAVEAGLRVGDWLGLDVLLRVCVDDKLGVGEGLGDADAERVGDALGVRDCVAVGTWLGEPESDALPDCDAVAVTDADVLCERVPEAEGVTV